MSVPAATQNVYFVGIKGVALAALAELMHDAGWHVAGSDVFEDFVTAPILQRLGVNVESFDAVIPDETDLVVYTAAHKASAHPQVVAAKKLGIRCLSHAEALAEWSNQKHGIAVCGVGGKSSISAMIAWVLEHSDQKPSFAIGVGGIKKLDRAGQWRQEGKHCVVEADEYATDPSAVKAGAPLIPRFHYLHPQLIVATAIVFDHPDVYNNAEHTWQTFCDWFARQSDSDVLISHESNRAELVNRLPSKHVIYYGQQSNADIQLKTIRLEEGVSVGTISYQGNEYHLELQLPGIYNLENACAAFGACMRCDLQPESILSALKLFASTVRRFEYKGTYNQATLYDDYAHHPRELSAVLQAAHAFVGKRRLIVAFQPHTFSRTKALWDDFVQILATIPDLILVKIFASARESADHSVTVQKLQSAIQEKNPKSTVRTVETIEELATMIKPQLSSEVVFVTIGAGTIYHVHELLLQKESHE